jgi:hypothetical protein
MRSVECDVVLMAASYLPAVAMKDVAAAAS